MPSLTRRVFVVFLLAALCSAPSTALRAPVVTFHPHDVWLNLHHFLYVLGRADAKMPDATRRAVVGAPADQDKALASLPADQQRIWREAVTAYASGPSKRDAIFDAALTKMTNA